ncbi:Lipid A export ATP-binding/permease protein MsbA [Hypsizygus marmoreus]|uniref:Lipid A export ATP-binding/permease protein MsbA n=1 Tax=Hypsizygus marmoreus TaxID=39966 RepID=A0A369JL19_HYPMA|nr:Lipid A export ATP-binding/permease protein MsbA [Hypsizygus marmoreus]
MPLGNSVATLSGQSQMRHRSSTRRFSWGIFIVSYSDPGRTSSFRMKGITISWQPFISTIRLIVDLCVIAPRPFAFLALGSLWLSTTPALSLYLSFVVLEAIHSSVIHQIDAHNRCNLFIFVCAWLGTAILSSFVDHLLDENKLVLGAHLRAHFLPELANARLRLDITHPDYHRLRTSLPNSWGFSEGAPALNFVLELSSRIRTVLTISFELFVLIHIVATNNGPDAFVLRCIGILFLVVVYWAPSNGLGGAGYTFWTKNKNYHKLCGLHAILFQDKYSETLTKDGVGERICRDYKNTSDALGIAKCDTFALACHLPPPWYWMLARAMILDYPMALYALALPWSLSSRSLVNMALVQHGTTILGQSIDTFKRYRDPSPLMIQVQRFYETLDYQGENDHHGDVPYPTPSSSRRGMKLSFRNVSCILTSSTGGSGVLAVNNASFSIEPGQLVVIVGGNGSGKTSLLKLIARLNEVSCGELLIDDVSVRDYDINDIRRSMAFLTQTEEVYPVSLSDNLVMGLPDLPRGGRDLKEIVDEAARLGGSYDLFQRLGYDTILDPPRVVGQSLKGCGNGEIGNEAIEELERHTAGMKEITISCGEKQRLVASRTFLRVKNSDIRLLVVDEPTSALDPVAERDLFEHFLGLRNGKTIICVTHRFGNIVKHADLILCMKGGQIVQKGTHEKLMAEEGEYKRLFTAQAE